MNPYTQKNFPKKKGVENHVCEDIGGTTGNLELFFVGGRENHWVFSCVLGCPWKLVTVVSKLGYITYLGDVSNLLILGLQSSY